MARRRATSCGGLHSVLGPGAGSPQIKPRPRPQPDSRPAAVLLVSLTTVEAVAVGLCLTFGPAWTSVFPGVAIIFNVIAAVHVWRTQDPRLALHVACYGLGFASLGLQWQGVERAPIPVLTWALWAPLLLLLAGGAAGDPLARRSSAALLLLVTATAAGFYLHQCLVGTPPPGQPPTFASPTAAFALYCVNLLLPPLLGYAFVYLRAAQSPDIDPLHRDDCQTAQPLAQPDDLAALVAQCAADPAAAYATLRRLALTLPPGRPHPPPSGRRHSRRSAPELEALRVASAPPTTPSRPLAPALLQEQWAPTHLTSAPSSPPPGAYHTGTVLSARLPALPDYATAAPGPDRLHAVQELAALFRDVVRGAVADRHGTVHELRPDGCLASWNCCQPCRDHADAACQAAVALQAAWAAEAARRRLPALPLSVGLWAGPLLALGGGELGEPPATLLGPGLDRAGDLQAYSEQTGRGVVASATVWEHLSLIPKCRLLPVDVLSTALQIPATNGQKTPCDAELVYEVLEGREVPEEEWMYQLQAVDESALPDKELQRLLVLAWRGVPDGPAFRRDLTHLAMGGDSAVGHVADYLQQLLATGHLEAPYCRPLARHLGSPVPDLSPGSSPATSPRNLRPCRSSMFRTISIVSSPRLLRSTMSDTSDEVEDGDEEEPPALNELLDHTAVCPLPPVTSSMADVQHKGKHVSPTNQSRRKDPSPPISPVRHSWTLGVAGPPGGVNRSFEH